MMDNAHLICFRISCRKRGFRLHHPRITPQIVVIDIFSISMDRLTGRTILIISDALTTIYRLHNRFVEGNQADNGNFEAVAITLNLFGIYQIYIELLTIVQLTPKCFAVSIIRFVVACSISSGSATISTISTPVIEAMTDSRCPAIRL